MNITINDLEQNSELDTRAMANLVGGSASHAGAKAGFLKNCRYTQKARDSKRTYKPCKFAIT